MSDKKESIKKEVKNLVHDGHYIAYHEALKFNIMDKEAHAILNKKAEFKDFSKKIISTNSTYQIWYSKASSVIRQILPERLDEFQKLYINEKRVIKDISFLTYTISDYFLGLTVTKGWEKTDVVNPIMVFYRKIELQIQILNSAAEILDSKLSNIEGVLQSELFETEIETARDILKKKHVRLAGALAGVTLESHLKKVCSNRGLNFRKANPTISDFNEELKKNELIDVPTWRLIQRLGDIRNLSVHSKDREPTTDEVEDLLRGTQKIIAELN